ncbi:hypothetical protein Trydic_g3067 [Trypoxylus dichotomus]
MRSLGGYTGPNQVQETKAAQKRGTLRKSSTYRTISEVATQAIAGLIPSDELAPERRESRLETQKIDTKKSNLKRNLVQLTSKHIAFLRVRSQDLLLKPRSGKQ